MRPPPRPAVIPFACVAFGEPHARTGLYLDRLHRMLARQCPQPFVLHCYTDRRRAVDAAIVQHAVDWSDLDRPGMRTTTRKLALFDDRRVPFESFVYLDLSLVVRRSMDELLDHAWSRPEDLVVVDNWHYAGFNSSVMRIRGGALRALPEAFVAGEAHPQHVLGDQDFIHAALRARGWLARATSWRPGQVVSYKKMRDLGRRRPEEARRRTAAATIVKFNGTPKMDQVFAPRYDWGRRVQEWTRGQLRRPVPIAELRRHWEGSPAAAQAGLR